MDARLKISFSTLGCPDWTIAQALEIGVRAGYSGLELRFVQGEASLWKLPSFHGTELRETSKQIADSGLVVCCVDTSCRFDSPQKSERERWIDEGVRMAELAAELHSPGIRVFGDRIDPTSTRAATQGWIVDSLKTLIEKTKHSGVGVWLETHGDFSSASQVQPILFECDGLGLVWDAGSAFVECGERPLKNGIALQTAVRHAHIKDLRKIESKWTPALSGDGEFPMVEIRQVLETIHYDGFLSFEWEKKWHPEIESPETAIPHFANWFRSVWEHLPFDSGVRT
jgi:sugar phosphate isomerase/epimerase